MKDVPSNMMKFMKKMAKKNMNEDKNADDSYKKEYKKETISKQNRQHVKKRKAKMRKMRNKHIPENLTPEERNKLMKGRTPRMRERSHKKEIHIHKK